MEVVTLINWLILKHPEKKLYVYMCKLCVYHNEYIAHWNNSNHYQAHIRIALSNIYKQGHSLYHSHWLSSIDYDGQCLTSGSKSRCLFNTIATVQCFVQTFSMNTQNVHSYFKISKYLHFVCFWLYVFFENNKILPIIFTVVCEYGIMFGLYSFSLLFQNCSKYFRLKSTWMSMILLWLILTG